VNSWLLVPFPYYLFETRPLVVASPAAIVSAGLFRSAIGRLDVIGSRVVSAQWVRVIRTRDWLFIVNVIHFHLRVKGHAVMFRRTARVANDRGRPGFGSGKRSGLAEHWNGLVGGNELAGSVAAAGLLEVCSPLIRGSRSCSDGEGFCP